ncbi:hypothetical protein [Flagellimonas meridianipacifica]|uniref:SdiA-regulated protein n=1 Tax=Flagellimonas meridianipacifica TaxID=1080225 RepID=A0A2T0MG11_9FLAO|nr:hypothetical protein [Allomuricauda pacifica]PRX56502.1 hypothetical protein CLV81_0499 [Allomuricauda pacifica]
MNRLIVLLGLIVCQACAQKPWHGNLDYLGKLPNKLNEVSGIVALKDRSLWVIEDNGNKDKLYQINLKGNLVREVKVENGKNHDWEDITKDRYDNIYIGDFGNNANDRKNLTILKIDKKQGFEDGKVSAKKIKFEYPEQEEFPPKKKNLHFDCEAFFHHGNSLYVITKNRARPYTGKAFIYKIPDTPGSYKAKLVGDFKTCTDSQFCSITGADISPDGKKIALLGSGFIWLYTDFSFDDFTQGKLKVIDVEYRTQQESICFLDNQTLLIADEQSKTKGRNLYRFKLPQNSE